MGDLSFPINQMEMFSASPPWTEVSKKLVFSDLQCRSWVLQKTEMPRKRYVFWNDCALGHPAGLENIKSLRPLQPRSERFLFLKMVLQRFLAVVDWDLFGFVAATIRFSSLMTHFSPAHCCAEAVLHFQHYITVAIVGWSYTLAKLSLLWRLPAVCEISRLHAAAGYQTADRRALTFYRVAFPSIAGRALHSYSELLWKCVSSPTWELPAPQMALRKNLH